MKKVNMYVPSRLQRAQMARLMQIESQLANEPEAPRVALLIDSPNAFYSAKNLGEQVRPDYRRLIEIARSYGILERALMIVNPGARVSDVSFRDFEIVRGTDIDCDHLVISCAVAALAAGVNVVVLVSGDGRFVDVGQVCTRLGVKFVAVGMPQFTSHALKAFPFHAMPTIELACKAVDRHDGMQENGPDTIGAATPVITANDANCEQPG